jgi:hypothetical protein
MEKTNFNVSPYFDDFDETKNFHRILFRPGFAVQGRELTQMQTILQNQIDRFGKHIFKDGSAVTGGQTNMFTDVIYLKLESTFGGLVLDVEDFDGVELVETSGRGARARVIAVAAETSDPPTLMVRYVSGEEFLPSDTLALSSAPSTGVAKVRSESDAIGLGSIATIQEGIFFIRGHFVHTPQQVVILDKYGVVPTYDIGLEITEEVITDRDDTSLLDPALDSSNFQAPGAHRFSIVLTFNKRAVSSIDLDEFVKIMKVEDGELIEWVRYPIYNEIEKTLARRTYDESGNYTVRSFRASVSEDVSNNNNYIVTLDPGKAYVFGFELETIAPTKIFVPKPRVKTSVNNYALAMNYGNYVWVQNANGFFNTSTFPQVDLHCVPTASLDFANSSIYSNTKIGTARVRDWVLESIGTSSLANTYVYRAHLFDVNTVSYSANSPGTNSTIASINLATGRATTANAYQGAVITITAGPGAGDRRTISTYDGSNGIAIVDQNFSAIPTSATQFTISFQFKDTESFAIRNLTGVNAFADIHSSSKDSATTFRDAYLTDTNFDQLLFGLPYSFVVATDAANSITGITDVSYQYRKVFTPTLTSNTVTLNLTGVEQFIGSAGVQSALAKQQNWFIEVVTPSSSSYGKGAVVPIADSSVTITISGTQTANVTVAGGGNSAISVIAVVNVTNGGRKTKTKVVANTSVIAASGAQLAYDESGTLVPGVNVYATFGQVDFANTTIIPKTSDVDLQLYIPDAYSLVKVVQSANSTTAVSASDLADASKDITTNYTFDNGQRNGYYNHSRIRLKAGVRPPTGQIRVFLSYYDHDTNQGYFSVDSYPNANNQTGYVEIPTYTFSGGQILPLRDAIDFRPRKTIGYANTFTSPVYVGASATNFNLDFAYYLARIDHLVLTRDRRFEVIKGIDAIVPQRPKARDDAMLLNIFTLPQYVIDAANVITIQSIENKRYTMRDIGALEKRIEGIEYYTTLSLLEQATINKKDLTILDDAGLERTKNGIIVDSFADFSACDVDNLDFRASIDPLKRRMKPAFNSENYDMFFYANGSSSGTYQQAGMYVMLPFTDTSTLVFQNLASKTVNINPFNVTKWAGTLGLSPSSDTWIAANVTSVITNPYAGIPLVTSQVLWSSWESLYHGQIAEDSSMSLAEKLQRRRAAVMSGVSAVGLTAQQLTNGASIGNTLDTSKFEFSIGYSTRAIRTIEYEEIRTTSGTRIINTTIIPFIRPRSVNFSSKNLRPNTSYYPFFDGESVINYMRKANVLRFTSTPVTTGTFTEETQDTYGAPDVLHHYDNYPPASLVFKGASILLTYAANVGLTVSTRDTQGTSDSMVGLGPAVIANTTNNAVVSIPNMGSATSGGTAWRRLYSYEHYAGNVVSATTTTLRIANSAHSNASFFAPSIGSRSYANLASFSSAQWSALGEDGVVRIVGGKGAGQARLITGYTLANNTFTVNTAWTTTPDTTSVYSIGLPRSVETGHCAGTFYLPNTALLKFRTGDRLLKLSDDPTNIDSNASSYAIGRYSAKGTLQEIREDVLVTRKLKSITERVVTSDAQLRASDTHIFADPIAQSFVVDETQFPNGSFVSKFRACFKTKDSYLPVKLQLRTMVNGFPSSLDFIEEVVLNPQYVKTTTAPSLTDSTKYTEFKFPNPLYLAPGIEYAFVLLSDSNQYNVYVSEMGQADINSGAAIARQPTLGSLFKSQNSSTWTPVQEEDLMFAAYICQFDTTKTANVNLRVQPISGNANVDVFYFTATSITPPTTDINYKYVSESISQGFSQVRDFIPHATTYFDDQMGRRFLRSGSNASFSVYASMTTTNQWVSPAIDISNGLSVFGIEYIINNGELNNTNIIITNGGTGYLATDNANITLSITGGGGSGAQAQVNSISNGVVTDIVITNPGSGYYATPNLTFSFTGNATMRAANTNVAATLVGETSPQGGNCGARYMIRKVTLADGFDSSDIRVYLTSYKPLNCQVYVYYKVLSAEDTDVFDNKGWSVMTLIGNSLVTSKNRDDLIEFTYAPGSGGVNSNEIIYNGFPTFRQFAIKVVMTSTNPIDVPEFGDIRVIALPSGKVI